MDQVVAELMRAFDLLTQEGHIRATAAQTTGQRVFREFRNSAISDAVADPSIDVRFAVFASADTGAAGAEFVIRKDAESAFFMRLREATVNLTTNEAKGLFFLQGRTEKGDKTPSNNRITLLLLGWNTNINNIEETSRRCEAALLSLEQVVSRLITLSRA